MVIVLAKSSTAGSISQLITVFLIFILVLFITVYTTKFLADYQKGQYVNRNLEVIETMRVANNKYLQIVRTADKYIVIGVGKDEISMLTEISEEDLIKMSTDKSGAKDTFASIFAKAGKSLNKDNNKSNNNE
ncbi:MAG: flagellar biosynthetic protein FliO [Lachnospiraceae bacterium]|nr:flagellar biosynthetic protein FliO [Lachnospiraceae bacterium]